MAKSGNVNTAELQAALDQGMANLMRFWSQASQAEIAYGVAWYATANKDCKTLSSRYGIGLETLIRVVAVLSPQLRWSHNVAAAEIIVRYYVSGGYIPAISRYYSKESTLVELGRELSHVKMGCNVTGANKIKALWILQGYGSMLRGPKVERFFDNIHKFMTSGEVTVDSHAILAWLGRIDSASVALGAPSFYSIIAADYCKAAEMVGLSGLEFQAVVWIVRRRLAESDKRDFALNIEDLNEVGLS